MLLLIFFFISVTCLFTPRLTSACRDKVISVKNARLVSDSGINKTKFRRRHFMPGELAIFVCKNGYHQKGVSPVMKCMKNGKWSRILGKGMPKCKPKTMNCTLNCSNTRQNISCSNCVDNKDKRCKHISCKKTWPTQVLHKRDKKKHSPKWRKGNRSNFTPKVKSGVQAFARSSVSSTKKRKKKQDTKSPRASTNRLDDRYVVMVIIISFMVTILIAILAWLYQKCKHSSSVTLNRSTSTIFSADDIAEEPNIELVEGPSSTCGLKNKDPHEDHCPVHLYRYTQSLKTGNYIYTGDRTTTL